MKKNNLPTLLLMLIVISCLWIANQNGLLENTVQKWKQSVPVSEKTSTDNVVRKQSCSFSDLKLPAEFTVYAVGLGGSALNLTITNGQDTVIITGETEGKKRSFQIDQSGDDATQMDVMVNSPNKPVVLILGASRATIWNISRTAETKILAVLAGGNNRQAVAGLETNIPLNVCGGDTDYKYIELLNPIAQRYFGHSVDNLYLGKNGKYDVIKIMPFGGNLNRVQMSGEWVEKALNANKQNRGKGSFLHFSKVTQENGRWLINQQAIDAKKLYKVVITDFLLEKGDNGLEFLTLKNNPSIKRLDVAPIDVRKALIQELTLLNNK